MIRNKSIIPLIIIMIISPIYLPFTVSAESWWNNSWSYKIKITVNQIKIDADLTDFPVMVYLNSSRIDWTHVQNNLDDLRFLDSTETIMLKAEFEKYVINDEAWIWVKVPIIDDAVNTNFYIYYGNSDASPLWDAENVWEASAVMVQHMRDATTSTVLDSTGNDNDGAKTAANEPIEVTSGMIGPAQNFDGINDIIQIANDPSLNSEEITLTAWIKWSLNGEWSGVLRRPSGGPWGTTERPWMIGVNDIGWVYSSVRVTGITGYLVDYWNSIPLTEGVKTFLGLTYNSVDGIKCYINGVLIATMLPDGVIDITDSTDLYLCGWLESIVDEIRVYNVTQSAEWIKADYNSGTDTLLIYGGEIFQLSLVDVVYPQSFSFEGLISIISIILIIGIIIYRR